jgi:hypothetical protein
LVQFQHGSQEHSWECSAFSGPAPIGHPLINTTPPSFSFGEELQTNDGLEALEWRQ